MFAVSWAHSVRYSFTFFVLDSACRALLILFSFPLTVDGFLLLLSDLNAILRHKGLHLALSLTFKEVVRDRINVGLLGNNLTEYLSMTFIDRRREILRPLEMNLRSVTPMCTGIWFNASKIFLATI